MREWLSRVVFWSGLLLAFAGLDVLILLSHTSRLIGFVLLALGIALVIFSGRGGEEGDFDGASKRWLESLLPARTVKWLFPLLGAYLAVVIVAFNLVYRGSLDLGSHDAVTMLLAIGLASFPFIPKRFARHAHFGLVFLLCLFLVLVVPLTIYSVLPGGGSEAPNSPFIFYLMALPTSGVLEAVGIGATAHAEAEGVMIDYASSAGGYETVVIGISCTGLYSVAIFVSALIAYVATEKRRIDSRAAAVLAAGMALSWVANILRMSTIVAVGSWYGADWLFWTHERLGLFIFLAWMTPFWFGMVRFLDTPEPPAPKPVRDASPVSACSVCGRPLTSVEPARLCNCGAVVHEGCASGPCPSCGNELRDSVK